MKGREGGRKEEKREGGREGSNSKKRVGGKQTTIQSVSPS